jgi:hypothetical protein
VRIYYRDPQIPGLVKGVVELVATGDRVSFHDSKGLLSILESAQIPRGRDGETLAVR